MDSVTGIGDWIHEKRKRYIEWLEDWFEWFGFFVHKHQNPCLMACFLLMWALATLSLFANTEQDHTDKIRMGSNVTFGYPHFKALKPYIGDGMGTSVSYNVLYMAGSNSNDGNMLTAQRFKDMMFYNDMITRGVHICRHKKNGKVKLGCDHPMARKWNYKNDCAELQRGWIREEHKNAALHYLQYDKNHWKKVRDQMKVNWPGYHAEYFGENDTQAPEILKDWGINTAAPCPTCKIADIKGTLGHCESENHPLRMNTVNMAENRYGCNCAEFNFGRPTLTHYKSKTKWRTEGSTELVNHDYQHGCGRCWNDDLDEPMPIADVSGMFGWQRHSLNKESTGFGSADGNVYETVPRFGLRTGAWTDAHVRRWFRVQYENPNANVNSWALDVNHAELEEKCGTRSQVTKKDGPCHTWKKETGADYAIGPLGDARCPALQAYEKCIEDTISVGAIIAGYAYKLPQWGGAEINPYKDAWIKAYEEELLGYIVGGKAGHQMAALGHVKPYFINANAYGRELGRNLVMAMPWYLGGGVIVGVCTMLMMGRIDWVDGRYLLAMFAILSGTACLFGGYGITVIFGQTAPIAAIIFLYLVIIAVAVDDMIIIVDEFEKVIPPKDHVQTVDDRIAWKISQALREVGPSITLTTLTTCSAFVLGAFTMTGCSPQVSEVMWIGAYAFALDYLYQLCFFVPLLLKDEKRRLKSRWGCAPCCCEWPSIAPGTEEERVTVNRGYITVFCEKYLLHIISSKVCRFVVVFCLLCTWIFSLAVVPQLTEKSYIAPPFENTYAAQSYARETTKALQRATGNDYGYKPTFVVLKDFKANDAKMRKHMRKFLDHMHYEFRQETLSDYDGKKLKGGIQQPFPNAVAPTILEKFHNDKVCACSTDDSDWVKTNDDGTEVCKHPYTKKEVTYGPCRGNIADELKWGPHLLYKDPNDDSVWPENYLKLYRPTYREQLNLILATPGVGGGYSDFVFQTSNDGSELTYVIKSTAFYSFRDSPTNLEWYTRINDVMHSYKLGTPFDRDLCFSSDFQDCGQYVFVRDFDLAERGMYMMAWIWELFVTLDLTMMAVVSLWLPFWAAFFTGFAIFVLQCHLFALLYIFDMKVGANLMVALSVTAGICVDEITHCIYHLVYSYGTLEERMHETIVGHGPSIIKGAISTMIGVTFISGSSSPFFRTFFITVFFLCLLGSIMGIVIVPSILVSFMGDNPHPDDMCFDDDFEDGKERVEMGAIGLDGVSIVENVGSQVASQFGKSNAESRVD